MTDRNPFDGSTILGFGLARMPIIGFGLARMPIEGAPVHPDDIDGTMTDAYYDRQLRAYNDFHAAHDGVALNNIAHPAGLGVVDDVDTQCKAYCDYWAHRLRRQPEGLTVTDSNPDLDRIRARAPTHFVAAGEAQPIDLPRGHPLEAAMVDCMRAYDGRGLRVALCTPTNRTSVYTAFARLAPALVDVVLGNARNISFGGFDSPGEEAYANEMLAANVKKLAALIEQWYAYDRTAPQEKSL